MKNTREHINKQILYLIREVEQNIFELEVNQDYSRFFVYNSFEPDLAGTLTQVSYVSGKMLEITDFLDIHHTNINLAYKQAFGKYVENSEFLNYKFSKTYRWLVYNR